MINKSRTVHPSAKTDATMMISDLDLPYKAPHLKNDFLAMTKKTYLGWYLTARLYTSVLC